MGIVRNVRSFGGLAVMASTALGLILPAGAVSAQEERGSLLLEEIIVTSQKREERLQDTPVSVTAFTGNVIRELGLTNSVDIAQQTPGLSIGTPVGEGNNPSITLRGVGLNDFNDNNEGTVAVYMDEVYLGSLAGQTFQLFDLERVEVLRGPQGTLYGRNATGGLVHFISRKPSEEVDMYMEATYGRYDQIKLEGAVGGPITDMIQARLAVAYNKADGYVENRIGPDTNESDNLAGRLMVNFNLNESLSLLLNAHGAKSDVIAAAYQHQGTGLDLNGGPCTTGLALAGQCTDFFGYRDTDGDPWAGEYNRQGRLKLDTFGFSGTLTWDFADGMTLTSITAYEDVEKFHQEDTDMSPNDILFPTFELDAKQFSQEVRINGASERFNWVVGAYYYDQDIHMPQALRFGVDLDPTFYLDTLAQQDTRSIAGFAQVEYDITPQFGILLGGRYTDERKKYDYVQIDRLGGVAGTPPGTVLLEINEALLGDLAVFDKGVFSGKAGLNWRPNDDVLAFASVSRGFKSGGFNAGFTSAPPERIKYNDEKLTAYEIGIKTTLGRFARFNATAFYYDYKDLQALTFDPPSAFITNAANAKIKGAEFELVANPFQGLDVNLGLSLLDTDADNLTLPDGSTVDNRKLVLAPKTSFNALVRYTHPVGDGFLSGQVDMTYRTSHYFDVFNQPLARENGYDIWNARVSYLFPGERFEIAVWGKNIFKEEYLAYTFDFTSDFGFNQHFYGAPATYGVTASFRY